MGSVVLQKTRGGGNFRRRKWSAMSNAARKAREVRCEVAIECGCTEVTDEQGLGEQGAQEGPKPGGMR